MGIFKKIFGGNSPETAVPDPLEAENASVVSMQARAPMSGLTHLLVVTGDDGRSAIGLNSTSWGSQVAVEIPGSESLGPEVTVEFVVGAGFVYQAEGSRQSAASIRTLLTGPFDIHLAAIGAFPVGTMKVVVQNAAGKRASAEIYLGNGFHRCYREWKARVVR